MNPWLLAGLPSIQPEPKPSPETVHQALATKVAIAVAVLNGMPDLGRPNSVRAA